MTSRTTIDLSEDARTYVEDQAREAGLKSASDYVETLIREDHELLVRSQWIRQRIEEGLASGSAGVLTRERLAKLVDEGIARAQQDK